MRYLYIAGPAAARTAVVTGLAAAAARAGARISVQAAAPREALADPAHPQEIEDAVLLGASSETGFSDPLFSCTPEVVLVSPVGVPLDSTLAPHLSRARRDTGSGRVRGVVLTRSAGEAAQQDWLAEVSEALGRFLVQPVVTVAAADAGTGPADETAFDQLARVLGLLPSDGSAARPATTANTENAEAEGVDRVANAAAPPVAPPQGNASGGRLLRTLQCESAVCCVAISPDGATLASGGPEAPLIWRTLPEGGERVSPTLPSRGVTCLAYSPDGRRLAVGGRDRTLTVFDPGDPARRVVCLGHTREVKSMAFLPDGRSLVSGSQDRTVRVWDSASGREIRFLPIHIGSIWSVAVSPDGQTLAVAGYQVVKVWDLREGRERAHLRGHPGWVLAVAFAPDGRTLATGGEDGVLRIWDLGIRRERATLAGHRGGVWALAYAPSGRVLASAGRDGTVRLWSPSGIQHGEALVGHAGRVWALAFAPGGDVLASAGEDGTVRLWSVPTCSMESTPHQGNALPGGAACFCSPGDPGLLEETQ